MAGFFRHYWGWLAIALVLLVSGRFIFLALMLLALVVAGFFMFGIWERRADVWSAAERETVRVRARRLFDQIAQAHSLQLEWLEGNEREINAWLPVQPGLTREIWMSLIYEEELTLSFRAEKPQVFDRYKATWFDDFEKAAHVAIGASRALSH